MESIGMTFDYKNGVMKAQIDSVRGISIEYTNGKETPVQIFRYDSFENSVLFDVRNAGLENSDIKSALEKIARSNIADFPAKDMAAAAYERFRAATEKLEEPIY